SWHLEGEDGLGSPAAYGRALATVLSRDSLSAADPVRFRAAIVRADGWLANRELVTTTDAAVSLLAAAGDDAPPAAARHRAALETHLRGQARASESLRHTPHPPPPARSP